MAECRAHIQHSRGAKSLAQTRRGDGGASARPQEVGISGEAIALGVAGPSDLVGALSQAGSATRGRIIQSLQRQQGNAYVQRLVAAAREVPSAGSPATPSIQRDFVRDKFGRPTEFEFRIGTDLSEPFVRYAQSLVRAGPIDRRALRKLRRVALRKGTITDYERMFMAGLVRYTNGERLLALGTARSLTFSVRSISANLQMVIDLERAPLPARVAKPAAAGAAALVDLRIAKALPSLRRAQAAARAEIVRQSTPYGGQAQALVRFIRERELDAVEVLRAMLAAASDSMAEDKVMAGAVFVVARQVDHPLKDDLLSGRIKVDGLSPGRFLDLFFDPKMKGPPGMVYVAEADRRGLKGDTIYIPSSWRVDNLATRGGIIHELRHAESDKARQGGIPAVRDEANAYREAARYILASLAAQRGAARLRSAKQVAAASETTEVAALVLETLRDPGRYGPVLAPVLANVRRDVTLRLYLLRPREAAAKVDWLLSQGQADLEAHLDNLIRYNYRLEPTTVHEAGGGLAGESRISAIQPGSPQLQRTPDEPTGATSKNFAGSEGTVFQTADGGIQTRFFLYKREADKEKQIRGNLPAFTAQITKMNALLADSQYAVSQLFAWTDATSGFRLVLGRPTVYLDSNTIIEGNVGAVVHEMLHALAYSYARVAAQGTMARKGKPRQDVLAKMAETYVLLGATKPMKLASLGVTDPLVKDNTYALGHFMVDPWNWAKAKKPEHPWENYEELFASAFEGYMVNRRGLLRSIAKYSKMDPAIRPLGKTLLSLLADLASKKAVSGGYAVRDLAKAESEIERAGAPPQVIKTTGGGYVSPAVRGGGPGRSFPGGPTPTPLLYLVDPTTLKAAGAPARPGIGPPRPSIGPPSPAVAPMGAVQQQKATAPPATSNGTGSAGPAWEKTARSARAAQARGDTATAEKLYRNALVTAAEGAVFPAGVAPRKPAWEDICLDLKLGDVAETRPAEIPANEGNYWRWIYFGPSILRQSPSFSAAVMSHELVHVRQYQKMWDAYKQDPSSTKGAWADYRRRFSLRAAVLGPAELEAEVTGLGFLGRVTADEQVTLLRGLLLAYVRVASYVPPKGEAAPITTAAARPLIVDAFAKADPGLQARMGAAFWWALLEADPDKGRLQEVLRELQPVAQKGYADDRLRGLYDSYLEDKGLRFSGPR